MGRSAYWKAQGDSLASNALGDANRGAFLALQSAVSTRRRLVATDPPERRAFFLFCSEAGGFAANVPWRLGGRRTAPLVRLAVASRSPTSCVRLPPRRVPPCLSVRPLRLARVEQGYCYLGFGGFASLARIASGLLRWGRARRGDGGACAFPVRGSGVRAQADRAQRPRRP